MKYFIIAITLLLTTNCTKIAYYNSHIGVGVLHTEINDPNYDFVNENEQLENPKQQIRSVAFGHSIEFDNKISLTATTNRLFNKDSSRAVRNKQSGVTFLNKTKITYDSLSIGKRVYKRYIPYIFLANTKIDKKLYYNDVFVGEEIKHAILYGFNLTTYLTKEISVTSNYIMPNNEFDLKYGVGLTINYNF